MTPEIAALEGQIRSLRERLSAMRRAAPHEPVRDYVFKRPDGADVRLSALFGDKRELIVVHNMGKGCPYCTLWADGFNGEQGHLRSRAGFVLCSPDAPDVQREFVTSRGWAFPTVSAAGNSFVADMGFGSNEAPQPGVSAFAKGPDRTIVRTGRAVFGPGDEFCAVWHLFDLLPGGPGEWAPKYTY